MTVEVWNQKRLPLAWLRADDDATFGVVVRERELVDGSRGSGALRNVWTLAPFERVTRTYHVSGERRGVYDMGPVDLAVGDLFARQAAVEERNDRARFIVRPRTVGTTGIERPDRGAARSDRRPAWPRTPRASPASGPYAPGDPLRRIHHRASGPSRDTGHEAVRAVARPRGADRPRRPDGPRPGLGDRVRPRRCRVAVRRRRVHRPGAGRGEGGVRARRGRVHRRRDAASRPSRSRRRAARSSGSSTCWPASPPTRRRRSSGCSRSSAGSPGRGRRSSWSRPATRRRSRAGSAGSRPAAAASSSSPVAATRSATRHAPDRPGSAPRPARLNGPWQTATALEVAS